MYFVNVFRIMIEYTGLKIILIDAFSLWILIRDSSHETENGFQGNLFCFGFETRSCVFQVDFELDMWLKMAFISDAPASISQMLGL